MNLGNRRFLKILTIAIGVLWLAVAGICAGCGSGVATTPAAPVVSSVATQASPSSTAGATATSMQSTATAGLLVTYNNLPVRTYSLDDLRAMPPFDGWAGFKMEKPVNPIVGPAAVTGVKITDIVASALGAALKKTQSIEIVASDNYRWTWTCDNLTNFTGFIMFNATGGDEITDTTSLKGTLAAVLVYSDPAGVVMKPEDGPLRFFLADSLNEHMVMRASESVRWVVRLDVKD